MNKSQLIEALSKHFEGNKKAAQHALESVLDTITREVAKGEKVAITGFGAFEKAIRPARMVRNPATGERIRAKKSAVPKFRPGADLKAVVSGAKKLPKTAAAASTRSTTKSAPAKKSAAKKAAAKKTAAKKTAKKSPAKKTAAKSTAAGKKTAAKSTAAGKKTAAKTTAAAKRTAKKAPTKKSTAKKAPARKSTAKKAPAKRTTTKKAPAKKSTAKKAAKKR